jgi:tetrahydromethanopterin S-methyltransferase subunit G
MTDDTASLMLEQFRHIRARLDSIDVRLEQQVSRLSNLEQQVLGARRDILLLQETYAGQQIHFDWLDQRTTRIERRLELVDPETPA